MPDPIALSMDIIDTKGGPALSATSDAPQVEQQPEPSVDAPANPDNTDGTSGGTEGEADGQPQEKEAGEGKDETPAPVKAVISREKNRRQAAEQREQAATERAARLEAQLEQALQALNKHSLPEAADPRPTRDTFSDPDAYDRAVTEWGIREGERRGREAERTELAQKQREESARTIIQSYLDRAKTFSADHPDFDDAVTDGSLPFTPAMTEAIVRKEEGPAVAYHLAQNPEVAQRIAQLDPVSQVYEIGRIAARLSQPAPTPKPEPVRPLGARQSNVVSPDQESMDQYGARRLAELRGQGRH